MTAKRKTKGIDMQRYRTDPVYRAHILKTQKALRQRQRDNQVKIKAKEILEIVRAAPQQFSRTATSRNVTAGNKS